MESSRHYIILKPGNSSEEVKSYRPISKFATDNVKIFREGIYQQTVTNFVLGRKMLKNSKFTEYSRKLEEI